MMNKVNKAITAKQHIANVLRSLREKHGYTQKDIGNITGKAHTTVASWESAKSQPDIDTLMQLCLMYDIDDVLAEFSYRNRVNGITDTEQQIVKTYRHLSPQGKELLFKVAEDLVRLEESFSEQPYLAVARGNGNAFEAESDDLSALKTSPWNTK